MSTKTVLIAKVLPFSRNEEKFIGIKVKSLGNLSQFIETTDKMSAEKTKRKREKLDHLSNEDKIKRRKLHNRAAAQLARDRKKVKMNELQQTVQILTKEKTLLERNNIILTNKCEELEKQNSELKQRLSVFEGQSSEVQTNRFVESAELINVSQPKRRESLSHVLHSKTPLIYWLTIMGLSLIQSLSSSTTVPNNFSMQTSIQQNQQMVSQLKRQTIQYQNWSPSKT